MNPGENEPEGPDPFKFDSSEDESTNTLREKIKVSRNHRDKLLSLHIYFTFNLGETEETSLEEEAGGRQIPRLESPCSQEEEDLCHQTKPN